MKNKILNEIENVEFKVILDLIKNAYHEMDENDLKDLFVEVMSQVIDDAEIQ
jgi:hypothetical protein